MEGASAFVYFKITFSGFILFFSYIAFLCLVFQKAQRYKRVSRAMPPDVTWERKKKKKKEK